MTGSLRTVARSATLCRRVRASRHYPPGLTPWAWQSVGQVQGQQKVLNRVLETIKTSQAELKNTLDEIEKQLSAAPTPKASPDEMKREEAYRLVRHASADRTLPGSLCYSRRPRTLTASWR